MKHLFLTLATLAAPLAVRAAGPGIGIGRQQTAPHYLTAYAATSDNNFRQGNFMISGGIGLIQRYSGLSLPLSAIAEYGIVQLGPGVLSGGLHFEYLRFSDDGITIVQPRAAYYYPAVDKLDVYGGLGLGFVSAGYGATGTTDLAVFVGGRYFFVPKFGAFAEFSSEDFAIMKIGVTGKF